MKARTITCSRVLAALVLSGMFVAIAGPASADDGCPVLDPECVTEQVGDTVEETTEAVEETANDTTETVGDTVTGDQGSGSDPGDRPGDGRDGVPRRPGKRGSDRTGSRIRTIHGPGVGSRHAPGRPLPDVPQVVTPVGSVIDRPLPADQDERRLPSIAAIARETATVGLVMAALMALVAAFVSFQHALDRRDPKLAPEVLVGDEVPFT